MPQKSLILQSASFEPGGDEQRQHNLESAMEKAGFEPEAPSEQKSEEAENESLTQPQILEKNLKAYASQVQKAKNKYDDWDNVVNQEIFIGTHVQATIMEQPNGADVVYYLGQHPDFAKKIGRMSKTPGREISAIREIERLSARLGANSPRPETPRRPIRPPEGASFSEIAAMPNYPGKGRDLKRAARR